jgi:formylglycine-generating enzyme required for sulfatase activity
MAKKTKRLYRLPSEAEWEYACRAGTQTPFAFGNMLTTEVANTLGLSDLHGNVWEWCADHWHSNYKNTPTDGSAWVSDNKEQDRVVRGGSWRSIPRYCRAATRDDGRPDVRLNFTGFRVCCLAPKTFPFV